MRKQIAHLRLENGQHAGLLLQRFAKDLDKPEDRRNLLSAAQSASNGIHEFYKEAYQRRHAFFEQDLTSIGFKLSSSDCRIIIGLGSQNVLEAGLTLHHTYGTPIIPGSALKGLAAHYCNAVWGRQNQEFRRPNEEEEEAYCEYLRGKPTAIEMKSSTFRLLFGSTNDGGCIVFHDAWITPDSLSSSLCLDVMTPHHKNWQLGPESNTFAPPTDFDSPTPISFLSVSGTFDIRLSWRGPRDNEDVARSWINLASQLLKQALADWGIGGKTNSGYGRLAVPPPPPPPRKRKSGEPAKVTIINTRTRGGFDVQDTEPGRNPGTLTIGSPPAGTNTSIGAVVDVLVHNDDPRKPQYRWPQQAKK